jgi:uncharacterized Ntn-hydrolase superfamily protein
MTFSIVARDPETGALGVATATAGPAVGALVPHGAAGIGAIATQAMTNPYLAIDGLEQLKTLGAEGTLARVLADDTGRDQRQLLIVDRNGEVAMWTGPACQSWAGHKSAAGVAVGGNIIAGEAVLNAMLAAYSADGTLPQRLLAALAAGRKAGGDSRGVGSAALKVYGTEAFADVDLRVDWSEQPIRDLTSLLERTLSGDYAAFFAEVTRRGGAG